VAPDILLYGTGGVAFQRVKETLLCSATVFADGCFPNPVTADATLTGWTAGAGIEAALAGNWLVRGESRYADDGRFTRNFAFGPTSFVGDVAVTTKVATHTAVLGLAYKFGAPVTGTFEPAMPVKAPVSRPS
jgi:outer membrane immunogenic protein